MAQPVAQAGLGLPQGDALYLFYREAVAVDGVRAGQWFWLWVGQGAAGAPSPSALRRTLPARHSLPPSSLWAGLAPAGSEQAQLLAFFTFKTTITMCACPLGASYFQTGKLVWFESSAAHRVGWMAGEAVWLQHTWQKCSSWEETHRCFIGLSASPPRACCS